MLDSQWLECFEDVLGRAVVVVTEFVALILGRFEFRLQFAELFA